MEHGHQEALRQVVQVLSQSQDIVALTPSAGIQPSPFHSGAEAAD